MAVAQRELRHLPGSHHAIRRSGSASRLWHHVGTWAMVLLVALALYVAYALITTVVSWTQVKLDDLRYGYPRTYQTDAYVGFNEQSGLPTHFVVMNAHRQVLIMIVPGGNPAHVSVIKGPYLFGPGQEFSPATLEVVDFNHDSYPDLRLHVAGQTITYLNDHRHHSFMLPRAGEGAAR
ncbi:MAG: hypothetical protein JWO59_3322 [Chloroflexi bacterium]|nr:hypothetical protein [Chloroflexota bacterium]